MTGCFGAVSGSKPLGRLTPQPWPPTPDHARPFLCQVSTAGGPRRACLVCRQGLAAWARRKGRGSAASDVARALGSYDQSGGPSPLRGLWDLCHRQWRACLWPQRLPQRTLNVGPLRRMGFSLISVLPFSRMEPNFQRLGRIGGCLDPPETRQYGAAHTDPLFRINRWRQPPFPGPAFRP